MESPGRALYSGELALCRQLQKAFKVVLVQAEEITKSLADSKTQLRSLVNLAEQLQVRNNDNQVQPILGYQIIAFEAQNIHHLRRFFLFRFFCTMSRKI